MRKLVGRCIRSLVLVSLLGACATNPVTGKKELHLVSQSQEIALGEQNYAPARQSQGGDYILEPELTAYVREVGNKLAAVSDRQLPYEFVVLNDSVPNAWAMPGGKIAFNRGLLYELSSEAELAAVLGHEIVHAAARHGAKSMERNLLLQGAVAAVGISSADSDYGKLLVGGAQIGAQLASTRYGRDAELESDLFGMRYMKRAGYDPRAAIELQKTFVRLSQGQRTDWLQGLFASHPPSDSRVTANERTAAELGEGGLWNREIYLQKTARLRAARPAYQVYEEGKRALSTGDAVRAAALAQQALVIEPREARFHELLGDVALTQKRPDAALGHYDQAIRLQPDYFKPHVQSGVALFNAGRKREAVPFLSRGNALLPTAPGHYFLGLIAEEQGDWQSALQNFEVAAASESEIGKLAGERYLRLDLPRNPARYLQAGPQLGADGVLYAVVRNPTPVIVQGVTVRVVKLDASGQVVSRSNPVNFTQELAAGKSATTAVGRVPMQDASELRQFRVVVEGARAAP
ncbi:MAG: M48 family metalloprotease [Burkholderiales bacterium]